jgi:hypothetical protein
VLPLTASERAYADRLDAAGVAWERPALYAFPLKGTTYTPDFFLPSSGQYVEVIGSLTRRRSIAPKLAAFRRAYPHLDLLVVDVADEYHNQYKEGRRVKHVPPEARQAAAVLGRLGGLARSAAKARAARENGRKGGRPASKKSGARPRRRT